MASTKASVESLLEAIEVRRSIYSLKNESTISNARIKEIVEAAIKHCPSAFNVQSARAVILFGGEHEKLWDMADAMLKKAMPQAAYQGLAPKVAGFRGAYGTVMWLDDQESLDVLKQKNQAIQHLVPECKTAVTPSTLNVANGVRVRSLIWNASICGLVGVLSGGNGQQPPALQLQPRLCPRCAGHIQASSNVEAQGPAGVRNAERRHGQKQGEDVQAGRRESNSDRRFVVSLLQSKAVSSKVQRVKGYP